MMLRSKLEEIPSRPGVYLLKGADGKILYIGKAKALNSRLRHYLIENQDHPRLRALVRQVTDVDTVVTDTEVEALILEANLIRLHRPRYNVNLKDDKRYPFIKITLAEPFPRLLVVRRRQQDGSRYFGPYTNAGAMRATVRTLRKIFPIRTCAHPLPGRGTVSLCLDYHIKRCPGPCEGRISERDYRQMIEGVCLFLSGRKSRLDRLLRKEMEIASGRRNFELAAQLRDQLFALQAVMRKQKVVSTDGIDRDVLAFASRGTRACGVILQFREGAIISRQHFHATLPASVEPSETLSTLIRRHYADATMVPRQVLLSHRTEDLDLLRRWLSDQRGGPVQLTVPRRGEKVKLVRMALINAQHLLRRDLAEREKRRTAIPGSVTALQRELNLKTVPRHLEAFDISNIGGQDAVGSLVVFRDGRARKKEYRHYKIRTVRGQDDTAMMAEVIGRRFRRLLREDRALPDLVVVDGGKGQVSAARGALEGLELEKQPLIGLAKRLDEVFLPGRSHPLMISKSSPALRLLQRIRDEAHRFAVEYHRRLRGRRVRESGLEAIPGIGSHRARQLLRYFGSMQRLRKASREDLVEIPGLGPRLAERIMTTLSDRG
jgi:excinuclease ABC subunit C